MGAMHYLSIEGDRTVTWDPNKVSTGDLDSLDAVREAERIFEEARKKGATAFSVKPGETSTVLERFDPDAQEIVIIPRVQGG